MAYFLSGVLAYFPSGAPTVYVSCDPQTKAAHTRVLERRGPACTVRKHEVGFRLFLWDLLPDQGVRPHAQRTEADAADGLIAWI